VQGALSLCAKRGPLGVCFRPRLTRSVPAARRWHGFLSGAVGLVGVALAAEARGQESVRFDYRAPIECPSAAVFAERVRERSLHARVPNQGELARTFDVTVQVTSDAASARVDFVDADGSEVFRTVAGATCDEVVSSIALVVALAIDARATQEEGRASSVTSSPIPNDARQPLRRDEPPRGRNQPSSSSPRSSASSTGERRVASAGHTWTPVVGLGAGVASHEGPSGALALDVFLAARPFSPRSSVRGSLFHFRSQATTRSGQEATFRGYGFRAEACPWALRVRRFFVEPCAGMDVGAIEAAGLAGVSVVNPRSRGRFWWQAEAISRLGVLLGAVVLEAQGELAVPLLSYRFGFGPETGGVSVFEMPRVGVAARAGAGVRF
jgi:hypothetical protein